MPASVRFEIFPADLQRCLVFYTKVLAFKIIRYQPEHQYSFIARDGIRIGIAIKDPSEFPEGAREESARPQYRTWPTGVELVVEVDDLEAERDHIVQQGWKLDTDIKLQTWGLKDFRVKDPDGYYIRITSKSDDGKGQGGT